MLPRELGFRRNGSISSYHTLEEHVKICVGDVTFSGAKGKGKFHRTCGCPSYIISGREKKFYRFLRLAIMDP